MRIGSLCSGYGGLDMAAETLTGGTTVWVSDVDKGANKILAHRYPDVPNLGDFTVMDWSTVEPIDVLTAGYPCQPFSHAGKRAGTNDARHLWPEVLRCLTTLRPPFALFENVRGHLSLGFDQVLADLASHDYDARWIVLRAADIGAPHGRARLFILASDARRRGDRWDLVGAGRGAVRVGGVRGEDPDGGADEGRAGVLGDVVLMPTPTTEPDTGNGHARNLGKEARLLPTPTTSDTNGSGAHGDGGADLRTTVSLMLPTRTARDWRDHRTLPADEVRGKDTLARALHDLPASTPVVSQDQQRILDKAKADESGCWLWTGWTNQAATPYGRVSIAGKKVYAHRASYEAFVGPIPDGYEIDHLCQTSLCVSPAHLEAVSPEENRNRVTQRRTHCKRGHEFTEENTYWVREGARACRACRAWQDKVQKAKRKGEEIPLLPTPACNDMGAAYTPDEWDAWTERMKAEHGNGNGHGKSLSIEAQRLLPTPTTTQRGTDANLDTREGARANLHNAVLLPMPRASDGEKGGPNQRGSSGDLMLPSAVQANHWGDYAPAIHRWEQILGRPAPAPTMTSAKGNPQLSPRFVEWMMGLPEGWVDDVPNLTRNEKLKALGNGVVSQQAVEAVLRLLALGSEVAA